MMSFLDVISFSIEEDRIERIKIKKYHISNTPFIISEVTEIISKEKYISYSLDYVGRSIPKDKPIINVKSKNDFYIEVVLPIDIYSVEDLIEIFMAFNNINNICSYGIRAEDKCIVIKVGDLICIDKSIITLDRALFCFTEAEEIYREIERILDFSTNEELIYGTSKNVFISERFFKSGKAEDMVLKCIKEYKIRKINIKDLSFFIEDSFIEKANINAYIVRIFYSLDGNLNILNMETILKNNRNTVIIEKDKKINLEDIKTLYSNIDFIEMFKNQSEDILFENFIMKEGASFIVKDRIIKELERNKFVII